MDEVSTEHPDIPDLSDDDVPVEAMHWTVAEHYEGDERLVLGDARQFDEDLRRIFARATVAPAGERADEYLARHEGELVARVAYWGGVGPAAVRSLMQALRARATTLDLRVAGLEATTLIELTAFGTAVILHWRYARAFDASSLTTET